MGLKWHFLGHLIDDGTFDKEICVYLRHKGEFYVGTAGSRDNSVATG
jgi:hypothetical protein